MHLRISYFGGTIKKSEQMNFKKLLFRATRGKAYVHFFPNDIPVQDRMVHVTDHSERLVYIIMFEEGMYIRQRIQKICSSFSNDPA
jgi:hypothetical protein